METPARLTVEPGLLEEGGSVRLRGELGAEALDFGVWEQIRPEGALAYDLVCTRAGETLVAQGSLSLPCRCVCGRCGGDFHARFSEPDFCESLEIGGLEQVDLTDLAREGILLALPAYPVCSEDCKGVCQRCGQNLNAGPCACPGDASASAWEALAGLGKPEA